MQPQWYLVREHGGEQYGPFPESELQSLVDEGRLVPSDRLWCEGMRDWAPASSLTQLGLDWRGSTYASSPYAPYASPHAPPSGPVPPPYAAPYDSTDRVVAAALAILLGWLGIHKIYYGATGAGIVMLLLTALSCGVLIPVTVTIGIIEGVIYLVKSDAEFYHIYRAGKKPWF